MGPEPFRIADDQYQQLIDSRDWAGVTPDEIRHLHHKTIKAFRRYAALVPNVWPDQDGQQDIIFKLRDACIDMSN